MVIDQTQVRRNIEQLADYAKTNNLRVRPHTKTHKSLVMSEWQLAAGATGVAVAKAGEAQVMSQVSNDILLAYPVVDPPRCQIAATLAKSHTLRVAIDSEIAIDALAEAARKAESVIGIMIEIDVGMRRTGVQTPADALQLAQRVAKHRTLRLDGLFFYPGHVWAPAHRQAEPLAKVSAILDETLSLWRNSGLEAPIVSGGSTPTMYQSHLIRSQTELRPGTYIFNDMNTVRGGFCELQDCAASIVCTVVSNSVPGKVVVDAGSKTLTSDRNATQPDSGHGHVIEYPNAVITRLSEEHGELNIANCPAVPRIGERVRIIPNHICPCVNLQNTVWLRNAAGTLQSLTIDARGLLT